MIKYQRGLTNNLVEKVREWVLEYSWLVLS